MKHASGSKSKVVTYKEITVCIIAFAMLAAPPVAKIRVLWITIPLYAAILILLRLSKNSSGLAAKVLRTLAGICIIGFLAVYIHYLLPRPNLIRLGTATVSSQIAPKIFFIVSGVFFLVTVIRCVLWSFHSAK